MKMKMKTMLMVAMVCLMGQFLYAATIDLDVVQNSNPRSIEKDTNWSGANNIWTHRDDGHKGYMQWDATGLAPVTQVESVTIRWLQQTRNGTLGFYAIIEDGGIDTWLMGNGNGTSPVNDVPGAITWNNAPGNNVVGNDSTFAADTGETVVFLGSFNSTDFPGFNTGTWMNLDFTKDSAEELLLRNALNSGDRKVTIGVANMPESGWASITIGSFQQGNGATLQVIPEPATLVLLGLGGLSLLRKRK